MILLPIAIASAGLLGLAVWKRKHDAAASTTTPARPGPGAPGGGGNLPPYGVEQPLPCRETASMISVGQPKEAAILLQRCKAAIAPAGWSSCDQAAQMIAIGQMKEAAVLFDRCLRGIPASAPTAMPTGGAFWRAHPAAPPAHTGAMSPQAFAQNPVVGFIANAAKSIANAHHDYGQGLYDGAANTMTGVAMPAITQAARMLAANPNAAGAAAAAQNAAASMVGAVQNFYARWKLYNSASIDGRSMISVATWESWTGGLAGALRLADDAIYQLQVAASAPQPNTLGHLGVPHAPLPFAIAHR